MICFCLDGATECGGITSDGFPISSKGVEIRLGDCKELDLLGDAQSNEVGNVGEILVRSPNMSTGNFDYFLL